MKWSNEINKVEVAYTGGGNWIAYLYTDDHTYYCADNIFDYFCKYDDRGEDEDEGMCMNIVEELGCYSDGEMENLTEEEQSILDRLLKALAEKE